MTASYVWAYTKSVYFQETNNRKMHVWLVSPSTSSPEITLILILCYKVVLEYTCQKDAYHMLGYADWKLFISYETVSLKK